MKSSSRISGSADRCHRTRRPSWSSRSRPAGTSFRAAWACCTAPSSESRSEMTGTSGTEKVVLPVEGMTCAACQANVQRALAAAPGVTKAAVNLMTHEATIQYDPAATSPETLVAAINDTGYLSRLPAGNASASAEDDAREQMEARQYAALLTRSVVSLMLGAFAMIASMPLM